MSRLTCKYHSDREANSKCERCGAMVCLECKNVLRQTHSSSSSMNDSSFHNNTYVTRHDLCPECYAEKINKSNNPCCFFVIVIFIIGFMGIAYAMFTGISSLTDGFFDDSPFEDSPLGDDPLGGGLFTVVFAMFLIIPILMIFCLGYKFFVSGPKLKVEANRRRDIALSALHGTSYEASPSYSSSPSYTHSTSRPAQSSTYSLNSNRRICPKCGQELDPNSSFCSGCGSFTQD
ncbi:MAG: zinc ribbon domain-containing protein [Promethearchaeota archaeon]